MNTYNYIISIPSAEKRRQHITKEFNTLSIPFTFFDAISPNSHSEIEINQLIKRLAPSLFHSSHLSIGEKGCFLSHLSLWEKCVVKNYPYIAIFEDDIILSPTSNRFLADHKWLDNTFASKDPYFILRFETFLMPIKIEKTNIQNIHHRKIFKMTSQHFGTAGYILTQQAAQYLLEKIRNLKEEEIAPIDELIFNGFLTEKNFTVYQLSPAIVVQELQLNKGNSQLNSQLEQERNSKTYKSKEKINLTYKIYKEIVRPFKRAATFILLKIRKKVIKFK
ncbi:glycosyltransferase family 25 protein [Avibacterium avium]|uniref:glycosyltransferase family 25 protein n=1 Tax=Avibacterium avium TaxID=751 RepID=UPI003BF83FF8